MLYSYHQNWYHTIPYRLAGCGCWWGWWYLLLLLLVAVAVWNMVWCGIGMVWMVTRTHTHAQYPHRRPVQIETKAKPRQTGAGNGFLGTHLPYMQVACCAFGSQLGQRDRSAVFSCICEYEHPMGGVYIYWGV